MRKPHWGLIIERVFWGYLTNAASLIHAVSLRIDAVSQRLTLTFYILMLTHWAIISICDIWCVNSSQNASSIFLSWFFKHACSACDFSQLCKILSHTESYSSIKRHIHSYRVMVWQTELNKAKYKRPNYLLRLPLAVLFIMQSLATFWNHLVWNVT